MRRITFAIVSTISAVVLLFSYKTSRGPEVVETASTNTGGAQAGIVQPPAKPNPPQSTPPAGADPNTGQNQPNQSQNQPNQGQNQQNQGQNKPQDVTVNGNAVQTEQGPVQVQVKIAGGRIVDVAALQKPSGDQRHDEISAFSIPQLRDQALAAQSAQIDGVSGATATSGGYRQSLQSALDAANFG
jgi:uncharacterized protein with FMN-binding domain